jgi:hypothetical protein
MEQFVQALYAVLVDPKREALHELVASGSEQLLSISLVPTSPRICAQQIFSRPLEKGVYGSFNK